MEWRTEFNSTDSHGRRVELQYLKRVGNSRAESEYRVMVGSRVAWRGWAPGSLEAFKATSAK